MLTFLTVDKVTPNQAVELAMSCSQIQRTDSKKGKYFAEMWCSLLDERIVEYGETPLEAVIAVHNTYRSTTYDDHQATGE